METAPLLAPAQSVTYSNLKSRNKDHLLKRVADTLVEYLKMVLSALLSGPRYVLSGLYTDTEKSSSSPAEGKAPAQVEVGEAKKLRSQECDEKPYASGSSTRRDSAGSNLSTISDEDELSRDMDVGESAQLSRGLSSNSNEPDKEKSIDKSSTQAGANEEITPRRSTRIKIAASQEGPRQRMTRRGPPKPLKSDSGESPSILDSLKSPSSPTSTSRMTRYPRTPAPPRPLVPQRRPSYVASHGPLFNPLHKTLILDLDETLIHSMAKGGRMGTGQMVEVKLKNSVGANGVVIGPQVPILYWVLKRPYCDEFLRKVSKWYNLIIFTASVQEYADPVIDILEQERKYFSGRYYRQHCTYRAGAYVKDLSVVEPDLSRVMILDNSPVSYIFHEDNAIPIEGWINDPEDNNLLHLIPLLEGLQHTTDVRALLALRLGEAT